VKALTILIILVLGIGPVTWSHTAEVKLTASDAAAGDWFGGSVSISSDYAIVGAHESDDAGSGSGSAYIFYRNQGGADNWGQQAKLTAGDDAQAEDYFGVSVAINGDYAIVGAYREDEKGSDAGAAYVFKRDGTDWDQQVKLLPGDSGWQNFGRGVALDGAYAIVGAYVDAGKAYIYVRSGENWTQQAKITASDAAASDEFGGSVSISGDNVIVGAARNDDDGDNSGSAYSFLRSESSWSEQTKLTASDAAAGDQFGWPVSINGNYAIVGVGLDDFDGKTDAGSAYIYHVSDLNLPTLVELSLFTTTTTSADGVTIRWRTEIEIDNAGFSIYRSEEKDGSYKKVTFVHGAENAEMANDYQFTDKTVEAGKTYFYYLEDIDLAGRRSKSEIVKVVIPPAQPVLLIPKKFRLLQNYPNPFNPDTWLPYQLATDATVTIRIYDVKGRFVRQLDVGSQKAGGYFDKGKAAHWDGKDQTGETVSGGLYFYTLKAGDSIATRRMAIVK